MNKFARFILVSEDGTLSTSKVSAIFGLALIVHIWVDIRYIHLEYDANVLAWCLEIILILLGLRGVDRFSRYGLSEVVGKVGISKKKDAEQALDAKKVTETKPTAKAKKVNQPTGLQGGNFSLAEFESRDGARMPASAKRNVLKLIAQLEVIREACGGKAITICSGYRSPAHNTAVDGKPDSQHMKGTAADIKVKGMRPASVAKLIKRLMDDGQIIPGGLKAYNTFTHYDIRGKYVTWRS